MREGKDGTVGRVRGIRGISAGRLGVLSVDWAESNAGVLKGRAFPSGGGAAGGLLVWDRTGGRRRFREGEEVAFGERGLRFTDEGVVGAAEGLSAGVAAAASGMSGAGMGCICVSR